MNHVSYWLLTMLAFGAPTVLGAFLGDKWSVLVFLFGVLSGVLWMLLTVASYPQMLESSFQWMERSRLFRRLERWLG
jgi:hypothetical protein